MTDKELEDFIHHGETVFLAFAMMFGDGWAKQAIDIAKELRARPAQPEQKPVSQETLDYLAVYEAFKTKPQRGWVGLTDEEIENAFIADTCCDDLVVYEHIARAIEAKLKEKNT